MEALLPSEVARLVYGYLVHENCHIAAQVFIENSPNLKECLHVLKNGRRFNTNIDGKNLFDLLDQLFMAKNTVKNIAEEYDKLKAKPSRTVLSLLKLFDIKDTKGIKRKLDSVESNDNKKKVKKTRKLDKGKASNLKINPLITRRSSSSISPLPEKFVSDDLRTVAPSQDSSKEESKTPAVKTFDNRAGSDEEWVLPDVPLKLELESDDSDIVEVAQPTVMCTYDSSDRLANRLTPPVGPFERAVTPPFTPSRTGASVTVMPSSTSSLAPHCTSISSSTTSPANFSTVQNQMPRRHILPQQPSRPSTTARRPSGGQFLPSSSQPANHLGSSSIIPRPNLQK